jgi:threonine/homoserine/homoserine lactone efflux protein
MVIAVLFGILTGIAVAIPPGPMGVILLKNTLNHGKRRGLLIASGTIILDFSYCLAFSFAGGSLFGRVEAVLDEFATVFMVFQAVCVVGLVAYGIHSFRKHPLADASLKEPQYSSLTRRFASHGPFFLGLGLSLTQIANPTFAPLMTYISLLTHEHGIVHQHNALEYISFSAGYAGGIFLWLYTLVRLSLRYRRVLSADFMFRLNRFVGLTLIGFGTYLGYRITMLIKWSDMVPRLFAF